jgi:acyl transferase domain-containing protein
MDEISKKNVLTGAEIAVIGMAGRFPGAKKLDEFWENLKNGIETIMFFSEQELVEAGVDSRMLENPNYVKANSILENIEYFDASFFDYTSREAAIMDPQVRIFHETAWEALENSGYNPDLYEGLIGIYAGADNSPRWIARHLPGMKTLIEKWELGNLCGTYTFCTRISYKMNLKGPSMTVQSACSTSLLAIHMAVQGLLFGECDMALAGGVSILWQEKEGYLFQEGMILPPDGHCRPFDARARGTVFGDGVGIVVLKRLEEAIHQGDTIHAVIKGSATNNDGNQKVGYTAPSMNGQMEVIRAALQVAAVDPETIGYIETQLRYQH